MVSDSSSLQGVDSAFTLKRIRFIYLTWREDRDLMSETAKGVRLVGIISFLTIRDS